MSVVIIHNALFFPWHVSPSVPFLACLSVACLMDISLVAWGPLHVPLHQINCVSHCSSLLQLLSPHSCFLRYDMITEVVSYILSRLPTQSFIPSSSFQKGNVQKRDRFLILYSDILVCACSRRKSSGFKRSSLLNLNSVFSDSFKYNIKWHLPLTKVSVAQTQGDQQPVNNTPT